MKTSAFGVVRRLWGSFVMVRFLAFLTHRAQRFRRGRGGDFGSWLFTCGVIHRLRRSAQMENARHCKRTTTFGIGMHSLRPLRDLCALCVEKVPNCFLRCVWGFQWALFLCVVLLADDGFGRERVVVARLDTGLNVVPFAVPVATPVAVLQPGGVVYSYSPSNATKDAVNDAKLWTEFEAFRRWRLAQGVENVESKESADALSAGPATNGTPLVTAHCLACHRGAQAKGGVRLDGLLSSDARLAAIRAVLAGEMPRGKTLATEDVGALLLELSDGAVSTSSVKGE
jgi:mono/diheme cytochrome c family protein